MSRPMMSGLFWATVFALSLLQFYLFYEALVCRGYPPLNDMGVWKMIAAPCFFWVPAVFGDRRLRMSGLLVSCFVSALLISMESADRVRPSAGSWGGVIGIIEFYFLEVLLSTTVLTPIFYAVLFLPEKVIGDLWRRLFWLNDDPFTPAFHDDD